MEQTVSGTLIASYFAEPSIGISVVVAAAQVGPVGSGGGSGSSPRPTTGQLFPRGFR